MQISNFTLTPNVTVTGQAVNTADTNFRNTTMLLAGMPDQYFNCITDVSGRNNNLTVNGDAKAALFSPYEFIYSVYFPGTSTLTTGTNITVGTNNFTFETWVYFTSASLPATNALFNLDPSANGGFLVSMSSTTVGLYTAGTATLLEATGQTFTPGTWYHIAVTRSGTGANLTSIFVNGRRVVNGTVATSFPAGFSRIASRNGPTDYSTAYFYNLRLVNGAAVYNASNGAISVPLGPLTAVSSTAFLSCIYNRFRDGSASNATFTVTGTPYVSAFNPAGSSQNRNFGSMLYDGTGDYLTAPSSASFAFGTGDFTIEGYIYLRALTGAAAFCGVWTGTAATSQWLFTQGSTLGTALRFGVSDGTTTTFVESTAALVINQWLHVAACRASGTLRMFVNGTQVYTAANSTNIPFTSTSLSVFSVADGSNASNGYLTDLRISRTALYTAAFTATVPSNPLIPVTSTVLLTNQYYNSQNSSTMYDHSSSQYLITRANNVVTNSFVPFAKNGWSYNFNGTSSYLVFPYTSAFDLSTGNWTMEAWFNARSFASGMHLVAKDTYGVNFDWSIYIANSTTIQLYTAGTGSVLTATVPAMSVGVWYHVAFVRIGSTNKIYLNGTSYASNTMAITNASTVNITIGCASYNNPSGFMNGFISNLRIVKGVGVYTANFTPPTSPLTATQSAGTNIAAITTGQTSLLTCQSNRFIDNSGTCVFIGEISATTLTVTIIISGQLQLGSVISGLDVTVGTTVTALGTGTGGVGTYTVGTSQTVTSQTMVSTGNTLTQNGNPSVQPFMPFAPSVNITPPTPAYDTVFGGGSYFFDGTSSSLQTLDLLGGATTSLFNYLHNATAKFTIEAWIYPTVSGTYRCIVDTAGALSTNVGITLYLNSSNQLCLDIDRAVSSAYVFQSTTGGSITANQWTHIAVTYDQSLASNNARFYINGLNTFTGTKTANAPSTSNATYSLKVGEDGLGGGDFTGYITNLRITSDIFYQDVFPVPTTPPNLTQNTTLLALGIGGVFDDLTSRNYFRGVGNIAASSQNPKWVGISPIAFNAFGAVTSYLITQTSSLNFGTGDFTVEFWIFPNLNGSYTLIDTRASAGATPWTISIDSSNFPAIYDGTSTFTSTVAITTSTWNYVAFSKSSGTLNIYVNGARGYSAANTSNFTGAGTLNYIANDVGLTTVFNGYIQELRATLGVGRYTGTTMSVPQTPLAGF